MTVRRILIVCLSLLGAGARAEPSAELVAAARKEGSLSFYAGFPNAALQALTAKKSCSPT